MESALISRGMALLGAGLFAFLVGLTEVAGGAPLFNLAGLFSGSFLLIIGFVFWERSSASPLLSLSMLKRKVLAASYLASLFQALGNFAVLFLIIMYLQGVMKLSPFNASLLLVPGYVLGGILAPFAGRVADKTGARGQASAGVLVSIVALGIFYLLLGTNTSTWVVIIGTMVNGVVSAPF